MRHVLCGSPALCACTVTARHGDAGLQDEAACAHPLVLDSMRSAHAPLAPCRSACCRHVSLPCLCCLPNRPAHCHPQRMDGPGSRLPAHAGWCRPPGGPHAADHRPQVGAASGFFQGPAMSGSKAMLALHHVPLLLPDLLLTVLVPAKA